MMNYELRHRSIVNAKYSVTHECQTCKRLVPDILFGAHISCGMCNTNVLRDEARSLGLIEKVVDGSCADMHSIYENLFAVLDARGMPHRHSTIHIINDILVLHLPQYVWDAIELTVGMVSDLDIDNIKIMESVLPSEAPKCQS